MAGGLVAEAVALREQDLFLPWHHLHLLDPFAGTEMRAVRIAQRRGGLPVRIRHYPVHPWGARLDSFEQLGVDSFLGDDFYRFGGVKLFVDGIGSDGLSGVVDDSKYEQDELNDVVARAERLGLQVLMHAFTRRGIQMAANAALASRLRAPGLERRHRIEHGGDYINLEDLELVRKSGVSLVTTPHFMYSGAPEIAPPTPLRSLIDAGFRPIGGTDSTGTVPQSSSPLFNMECAVTRRRFDGTRGQPSEAIEIGEALRMFTTWAAYGAFEDSEKGRLHPGHFGDCVVLSADPTGVDPGRLSEIRVDATVVGGRVVFAT